MMKRVLALIVFCLLMAASAPAETGDGAMAALREAGISQPVQLCEWGDTAACFAEIDGMKWLVMLERQEGTWGIVIQNPKALIQDAGWPELWLDSDDAIFWTYTLSDQEILRYHSSRDAEGIWGPVDQYYADSGFGDLTYIWNTMWDEANGGEIIRCFSEMDGNDNLLGGVQMQFIPAGWLGECIRLADFDLTRFPTLVDPQYGAWFETDRFFREAAAALMPEDTYIRGMWKDGEMHFLMQKPDGTKVYVICEYASHREVHLIESSPLPDDTVLGYENFTDSLRIGSCCVTIHLLFDTDRAGIEYIYRDGQEGGFLFFGDRTVWSGATDGVILYGDHPWEDITRIDWEHLPQSLAEASAQMDSSRYAMVVNPKPTDRLHLREQADKGSRSRGKYYTGTPVTVQSEEGEWARVWQGSWQSFQQGWMMKQYLAYGRAGTALRLDTSAMPVLFPREAYLKVYTEPQEGWYNLHFGDDGMKIIGVIGNDWYHVWFPATGEYGFVRQDDLWEGNG